MAVHFGTAEDVLPVCRNQNYASMTDDWSQVSCPTCLKLADSDSVSECGADCTTCGPIGVAPGQPLDESIVMEVIPPPAKPDPVRLPSHYRWHPVTREYGVECIDIAGAFDFYLGNVIKYVWRADHKGKPVEDLKKAATYLERAIEQRLADEDY